MNVNNRVEGLRLNGTERPNQTSTNGAPAQSATYPQGVSSALGMMHQQASMVKLGITSKEITPPPTSPSDPLKQIKELPVPQYSDIPRQFSPEDRKTIYEEKMREYHKRRAEIADQAIQDLKPPTREDFKGLPPRTAEAEYTTALNSYNQQIAELQKISQDSKLYLNPPAPLSGKDRVVLSVLGVELSEPPTGVELAAAHEILKNLPPDLASGLFETGSEIIFGKEVKVAPGASGGVTGSTTLSNVQMQPGFDKQQKLTIELEVTGGLDISKSKLSFLKQKALDHLDKINNLPPAAQNLIKAAKVAGPLSFSYQNQVGTRLTIEATVTPGQAKQIENGEMATPNPFDPASMPTGTAVLITGQALERTSVSVGYKFFGVDSSVTKLAGFGIGVEKLDGNVMRVTTGPVKAVENEAFLGLNIGLRAGINSETNVDSSSMRTAEFNLNTPEGQKAYQEFLMTGQVPSSSMPGVIRSGRVEIVSMGSKQAAELRLGELGIKKEFYNSNGHTRVVTWDDGTKDVTCNVSRNNFAMEVSYKLEANGNPVPGSAKYILLGAETAPGNVMEANLAFTGDRRKIDGAQDVQIVFTEADLNEIRSRAQQYVNKIGPEWINKDDLIYKLAQTQSADEASFLLVTNAQTQEAAFNRLATLCMETGGTPLPGQIEIRPS